MNWYRQSIRYLQGIGEKRAIALEKAGISFVEDLLTYFPRKYLDRSQISKIRQLRIGQNATVVGQVLDFRLFPGRRPRFVLRLADETGELNCVWFHGANYMKNVFQIGEVLAVHGKVRFFRGYQISHPEYDRLGTGKESESLHTGKIIPLYPSSKQLSEVNLDSRGFRRLLWSLLGDYSRQIEENLPPKVIAQYKLLSRRAALNAVHFPDSMEQLQDAQRRLKFEELFFLELMMAYRRLRWRRPEKGIAFERVGERTRHLVERLPFQLTEGQKQVLREIVADMKKPIPMNRLLQGDVGSGKTVVALVSMLIAVENGYQAALMAPTEILAEQHYLTFHHFLEGLGVRVALLIGNQSKKQRQEILEGIAHGKIEVVVGTHALIQEGVNFPKLGLVVIDEQHRFGVMQRAELCQKGYHPNVLVMTATPIPRTLSLTIYGDLDISILDEKPAERATIRTTWRFEDKRDDIYLFVRQQVLQGQQAYVVFPLVEKSEKMDLLAATESFEKLRTSIFKDIPMALLHGRLRSDEKEKIMNEFKAGNIKILVSTTVIEVGIDVPNATIMVIEHAERFGLTQLHQLRGRVGRGLQKSYCILIAKKPLATEAWKRLETMVRTNDGFKIAEVDLQLRGPGEFFGVRQHGLPNLKIADIISDSKILLEARRAAFELVESDPALKSDEHQAVRNYFLEHYQEKMELGKVA